MKGWEALKALQEGKYIHEYEYPSPYGAFFLDGKNLRLKCVKKTEEHDVGYVSPSLWDFKISDFLSKQWEIYEEPEEELEPCPLCGNNVNKAAFCDSSTGSYYAWLDCDCCSLKVWEIEYNTSEKSVINSLTKKWNTRS